ncbi:cytochrome p450 [Coprinopsis marcescibilis]|uniref:Cytochrome p450 n=1 Tax=Coprinopsis marcescibilis TaxID=230819 RepID=A0A5C3L8Z6_COPMA|nr:cytochrome p450 [Coprinopsis marcescibilis]
MDTMIPPTASQVLGISFVTWMLWRIAKKATAKNPLDNVAGPPSKSFLKGNFPDLVHPRAWDYHIEISEKYGGVLKFSGFFSEPHLYVFDPKALHHIIVKDQYIYDETDSFFVANEVTFGKGLLATGGEHHRKQRKMLNPVFSIAHMREMVPIFYDVVYKLRDGFTTEIQNGAEELDILAWMTRTALELIGQSGLGHSFDPLTGSGSENPYSTSVKLLVPALHKLNFSRFVVLPLVYNIGPTWFRRGVVNFLSIFWGNLRRLRDIVDIITKTSIEIYESKKKALGEGDEALEQQIGRGKVIISILMKANMEASEEDRLPESELLGQMSTLTFAAMDTTSNALSRIFHLLSEHPEVQERLREEIQEAQAQNAGELDHDQLVNLPYLDAVCRETMRVYPPVPMLLREARQDMMLPVSKPLIGADGKEINEILVPKGTKIFISTLASNRNRDLWGPDAHEWKPERWLSPLPEKLVNARIPGVYSHLMTFLGGGRSCIGFKFSQLEMKIVLIVLLSKFKFECLHKNVFWQMNGIAQPILEEAESLEPKLPLKVTFLDERSRGGRACGTGTQ